MLARCIEQAALAVVHCCWWPLLPTFIWLCVCCIIVAILYGIHNLSSVLNLKILMDQHTTVHTTVQWGRPPGPYQLAPGRCRQPLAWSWFPSGLSGVPEVKTKTEYTVYYHYASVGGAPEAYGSRCVCVCLSVCLFVYMSFAHISLQRLKTKR